MRSALERILKTAALVLALLSGVSCESRVEFSATTLTVRDQFGSPVQGAEVYVEYGHSQNNFVDSLGWYTSFKTSGVSDAAGQMKVAPQSFVERFIPIVDWSPEKVFRARKRGYVPVLGTDRPYYNAQCLNWWYRNEAKWGKGHESDTSRYCVARTQEILKRSLDLNRKARATCPRPNERLKTL